MKGGVNDDNWCGGWCVVVYEGCGVRGVVWCGMVWCGVRTPLGRKAAYDLHGLTLTRSVVGQR